MIVPALADGIVKWYLRPGPQIGRKLTSAFGHSATEAGKAQIPFLRYTPCDLGNDVVEMHGETTILFTGLAIGTPLLVAFYHDSAQSGRHSHCAQLLDTGLGRSS